MASVAMAAKGRPCRDGGPNRAAAKQMLLAIEEPTYIMRTAAASAIAIQADRARPARATKNVVATHRA